jgi:hypothetical protein
MELAGFLVGDLLALSFAFFFVSYFVSWMRNVSQISLDVAGAQKRTAQLAPRPVETASGGTPAFVAPVLYIPLTVY